MTLTRRGLLSGIIMAPLISHGAVAWGAEAWPASRARRIFSPYLAERQSQAAPLWQITRDRRAAYREAGLPQIRGRGALIAIDAFAHRRFLYAEDRHNSWKDLSALMMRSREPVSGDCEDLALSVISLCLLAGAAPEDLGLAFTGVQSGLGLSGIDHCFALASRGGRLFIIGDTRSDLPARPFGGSGQHIEIWARVDELLERPGLYRRAR